MSEDNEEVTGTLISEGKESIKNLKEDAWYKQVLNDTEDDNTDKFIRDITSGKKVLELLGLGKNPLSQIDSINLGITVITGIVFAMILRIYEYFSAISAGNTLDAVMVIITLVFFLLMCVVMIQLYRMKYKGQSASRDQTLTIIERSAQVRRQTLSISEEVRRNVLKQESDSYRIRIKLEQDFELQKMRIKADIEIDKETSTRKLQIEESNSNYMFSIMDNLINVVNNPNIQFEERIKLLEAQKSVMEFAIHEREADPRFEQMVEITENLINRVNSIDLAITTIKNEPLNNKEHFKNIKILEDKIDELSKDKEVAELIVESSDVGHARLNFVGNFTEADERFLTHVKIDKGINGIIDRHYGNVLEEPFRNAFFEHVSQLQEKDGDAEFKVQVKTGVAIQFNISRSNVDNSIICVSRLIANGSELQ